MESNLIEALVCVSRSEVIEGTIYAYRDWDAQPCCDLILAQFSAKEVAQAFLGIKHPDANMKVGVLGFLADRDRAEAKQIAIILNEQTESEEVLREVRYILSAS